MTNHRFPPDARRAGIVLTLAAALSGCGALTGPSESYTIYSPRLSAPATPAAGAPVPWQLAIETPLADRAFDSTRLLVMPAPGVIEIWRNARWRDAPPALVRDLLIEAFENSGRIVGVSPAGIGLRADYTLITELREFATDYSGGSPHAVVTIAARLLDANADRVLAARRFHADVALDGSGAGAAAAAIERGLNQVLPQIVDWTLAEGSRHGPPALPADRRESTAPAGTSD
jgi:cholesterol transport system auxiliary component